MHVFEDDLVHLYAVVIDFRRLEFELEILVALTHLLRRIHDVILNSLRTLFSCWSLFLQFLNDFIYSHLQRDTEG